MKHLINADSKLKKIIYGVMLAGVVNFLLGDIFGYNPVDEAFGRDSATALVIYAVVGLAVLYVFYDLAASLRKNR